MILLRKIAVVGIAVAGLGCDDVAGPPPLPAAYSLSTINGRALPTPAVQMPDAPVVTSSLLQIGADGTASITENLQTMTLPGEVTQTTNYTYTIRDNTIEFHLDCPPTAFCSAPPVGFFSGPHLFLTFKTANGNLVYDYLQGVLDFYLQPQILSNHNTTSE
jgi:hypothetical protein